jgi:hypothetical protein
VGNGIRRNWLRSQGIPQPRYSAFTRFITRIRSLLAGTTTFGTQGAVEFVSRPDSVAKMLQEMPGSVTGMKPFEALLRVKVARGVPVETELVALRPR